MNQQLTQLISSSGLIMGQSIYIVSFQLNRSSRQQHVFFFQAEDGIRDGHVTGVQTCALPISGSMATKEALRQAKPVILEPVMSVEVRTPEEYMGDVIGDLNARRGQVQSMEDVSGVKNIRALVPLSEMFGYVGDLRSKTQGRAMYTMQFDSYAEVPGSIAEEIVAKTRGE